MGSSSQQQRQPWLSALLDAKFECIKGRNPSNSFCINCLGNAISREDGENHRKDGHNVVSVMKASGYYALITDDIKRQLLLDCSDICVFHINGKEIVFLNSRQHRERLESRINANCCTICGWTLTGSGIFCSLGCKFRNNDMRMVSRMEQKESEDDCSEIGTYTPNPKRQRRVSRTDQEVSDDDDDCCEIGTYTPNPKREQRLTERRRVSRIAQSVSDDECCEIGNSTSTPNPKRQQPLTEGRRVSRMAQNVSDDGCCEMGTSTSSPNPQRQPQLTEMVKSKKKKQSTFEIGSKSSRDEDNDREQQFQPSVVVMINIRSQQLTGFRKRSRKGIPKRAPLFLLQLRFTVT